MSDYKFSHAALLRHVNNKVDDETYAFQNIMECPIYTFLPWKLPGLEHVRDKGIEQCYFVSRERSERNPSNPKRTIKVTNGEKALWLTNGSSKDVYNKGKTAKIGRQHRLIFMYNGEKTPWIMHEYTLPQSSNQNGKERFQKWVVCKITRNGRAEWSGDIEEVNHNGSIVSSNSEGRDANNNAQLINVEQLPQQHHYIDVQENNESDVSPMELFNNEEEEDGVLSPNQILILKNSDLEMSFDKDLENERVHLSPEMVETLSLCQKNNYPKEVDIFLGDI